MATALTDRNQIARFAVRSQLARVAGTKKMQGVKNVALAVGDGMAAVGNTKSGKVYLSYDVEGATAAQVVEYLNLTSLAKVLGVPLVTLG